MKSLVLAFSVLISLPTFAMQESPVAVKVDDMKNNMGFYFNEDVRPTGISDINQTPAQSQFSKSSYGSGTTGSKAAEVNSSCNSSHVVLVDLIVLRKNDGSGNAFFPPAPQGQNESVPNWILEKLEQASQLRKNPDGSCAVRYSLSSYTPHNNDKEFSMYGCDVFYKYSGDTAYGRFTVVVPSPGSYNDSIGQYYGCTAQANLGSPILNPISALHMDDQTRVPGDLIWELGHNYGYAVPSQMSNDEYIRYADQLKNSEESSGSGGFGATRPGLRKDHRTVYPK